MRNYQKGYIALSTVLITLALVLLIGVSASLLSINDLLSADSGKKANVTVGFVDSCIEEALLHLNEESTIDSSIVLPNGTCSVTINSQSGNTWDFTVNASFGGYYKTVRLNVNRDSTVVVNSWINE